MCDADNTPRIFADITELAALTGQEIGVSGWLTVDQQRIDMFAEATGDHYWIHVDVERARRESPFGRPIAHGFLTLSLLAQMAPDVYTVEGATSIINYGLNKVRFMTPVKVDSRLRLRLFLLEVSARRAGRYLTTCRATFEIEGQRKPACVAESLLLYTFDR